MSELRKLFYLVQRLSKERKNIEARWGDLIEDRWGFHYSDEDLDLIIDTLDYGQGTMTFREFVKIMDKRKKELEKEQKLSTEVEHDENK